MYQDFTDVELVERYKKHGDPECVGVLFKRYSKMSYAVCLRMLKDPAESKEAVMIVFERLFDYLKKYKIENFWSWLLSVLRNQCCQMLKASARLVDFEDFYDKNASDFVESGDVLTPSDKEQLEQRILSLCQAMRSLPAEQARCVELFYLKGKSYEEITDSTGYTFNQVKSYIQNGRRNLKNILSKPGSCLALLLFLHYFCYL